MRCLFYTKTYAIIVNSGKKVEGSAALIISVIRETVGLGTSPNGF